MFINSIFFTLVLIQVLKLVLLQFVQSDADEELLFNIPFTGNVKLKGIRIASEDTDSHPDKLRL